MSDLLGQCERVAQTAARSGADAAEVFGLQQAGGSVSLERGTVDAAQWEESEGFGIRVLRDDRVGFAYASKIQDAKHAIQGALRAAKLSKPRPAFRFQPKQRLPRVAGLYQSRVADVSVEELLEVAGRVLDSAKAVGPSLVVAGGSVSAGSQETALANTEGFSAAYRATDAGAWAYVVHRGTDVSTGFASEESNKWDVQWEHVGTEAARLCVDAADAKPLTKGGRMPVVLRPEPFASLLNTVTVPSLCGKPAHRGESAYSGKQGAKVAHERLSLVQEPDVVGGLGSQPFDDEGVASRTQRVVQQGVLKRFLFDGFDAAEFSQQASGNAERTHAFDGRSYKAPPSTGGTQMRLVAPKTTTAKLVADVDHGILVHDLMGVHTANATSGDFSVTSSLLFRIRKGAVEEPLKPVAIAGNVHKALRTEIRMGNDVKRLGGSPAWNMPSVAVRGFTVTP